MSYCKGDVYLYQNNGGYVCFECKLARFHPILHTQLSPVFQTRLETLDHLRAHLAVGHDVPPRAFIRLWREIELQGF